MVSVGSEKPLAGSYADAKAMIAAREIIDAKSIIGLLMAKAHLAGTTPA